ncbi:MAG: alpha/beta fold hydrolase, partial [Agromyces sp.]
VGGGAFHVAGDSLGGAIALELAIAQPHRVLSLAMFASDARIGTAEGWAERAAQVRGSGTASLVAGSAERWFAPGYLAAAPDGPGSEALLTLIDVDDASYAYCTEALGAFDRRPDLGSVAVPTIVVAGAHDAVVSPAAMRELADAVPGARFVEVEGAAHLIPLEAPVETARLLREQLDPRAGDAPAASVFDRGMTTRRAVLGDAHVDRATAAATAETADFQDFITRYAWGEIWSRPQLTRTHRSIATLASLVTGRHEHELRMHVRAALRNGLSRAEIAETILHTALYSGLPAAYEALAAMRDTFAEEDVAEEDAHG